MDSVWIEKEGEKAYLRPISKVDSDGMEEKEAQTMRGWIGVWDGGVRAKGKVDLYWQVMGG